MNLAALLLAAAFGQGPEVRFEVRELSGVAAQQLPVTLSAVLAPSLFHDDDVCVVLREAEPRIVPAQLDVLSRHGDGSIQHALVTLPLDLSPRSTREIYLVPSPATPLSGAFVEAGAPAPAAVAVELVDRVGVHFTLILELPAATDAASVGPLAGPLAEEVERVGRLHSAKGELANLEVRARWRRLAGVGGARVEVVVENTPPPRAGGPAPDDVEFSRLAILAGDEVLADLHDGVVHDRTRFVVRRHVGATPPRLMVREDLGYLERNGWLPPYDASQPLAEGKAAELARRIVGSSMNGDVDGATWPCGIPLDPGPIARYMPSTGDRGDIGPIPTWAAIALNSRSMVAEDVLFAADQNGAGSFPIHVRAEDGVMGLEFGPAKAIEKRQGRLKCPRVADRAHAPLLGYVTFLLTGERFAEEELAAEAAYCFYDWPHDGRYRYPGSRDFAWSLRTTMLAAKLLPDAHPRKAYFGERMRAELARLHEVIAQSDSPLHAWGSGSFESSGRKSWPCATQWSAWQATWIAGSLWWTDRLHDNADARFLYEWLMAYYVRAYAAVGESWTAPDGTRVVWESGHHALAYSFPVATYVPTIVQGDWKQLPESRHWIGTFAEGLWWLRVNLDHEFEPGKFPPLPIGADGVPSQPPERWLPNGPYSAPPQPARSWIVYAMHWLSAIVAADELPGGAAIEAAVRPAIESEIGEPGLRMSPKFATRKVATR